MPRAPRLPGFDDLTHLARLFELRTVSRWVGLCLAVGVASGLGAAALFVAMDWLGHLVLEQWAGLHRMRPAGEPSLFTSGDPPAIRWWLVVLAPALGGLVSGLIVTRLAPEAEGHGTDALIDAFHRGGGRTRRRVPLVKGLASIVLIGTGGSAGREGPIAQIGAGVGSMLGRALRLSAREQRLLLLAGAAGGIGAIFRTPLGAALFVVEVLYSDDFEVDALVPTVLASVVGYSVFTVLFGEGAMFRTLPSFDLDPRQLPLYLVMAMGAALVGVLYIKTFYAARDRVFPKLPLPRWAWPAVGGLAVGLLALAVPQALGAGYGSLQAALDPGAETPLPVGWVGAGTLLGIGLLKVVTTSLSVGSGGSGGVFGPSVVIGGMVGGAFGIAFQTLAPNVVTQPSAFVMVGMACFVGGVARAPVSTLVMASEMTGSYELLVPLMLAEAVTFVMMRRWTLYERQVPTRRDSAAHGGEYVLDVLEGVRVRDVYREDRNVRTFDASAPLPDLLREATCTQQTVFPVMDAAGRASGLVTLDTLREFFFDEDVGRLAIAADCATTFESVAPNDSLAAALRRFGSSRLPQLPVVDDAEKILGWLGYEDLLRAYSQELVRRRLETEGPPRSNPAP